MNTKCFFEDCFLMIFFPRSMVCLAYIMSSTRLRAIRERNAIQADRAIDRKPKTYFSRYSENFVLKLFIFSFSVHNNITSNPILSFRTVGCPRD